MLPPPSPRSAELAERITAFMDEHVYPAEPVYEREIREAAEVLRRHRVEAEILPLYSRLSNAEQDRVFRPGGTRRVVLATNVAETSLTVPRIHYVVDTGQARVKRYSYRNRVEMLRVENVSRAAAHSSGPSSMSW